MEFKRFRDIIIKNREYEKCVSKDLKEFYDRVQWDGDIPKIMREIGQKLDVLTIEIPMKDDDFGACFFQTEYSKYLLLNSNQPRSKMYFSFCHDIYHILNGVPDHINEKREVHFNQDYLSNENECKANLFAANLLMPELEFKKMYNLYANDNDVLEKTIIKLMHYFNSPFIAVLLRVFELKILNDIKDVAQLLEYDNKDIEKLFDELWLDKEILEPTLKDEMPNVLNMLNNEGVKLIEEQLLSEYDFKIIMESIERLYSQIKYKNE
ncbi:ImmA/IrrE family metallo-endopeptidase [Bacillus sp. ME78]|uniref:ImmA/IrrE family metallo-endopeptidase n=1 Tax=Bacillus sp. ME78 TaxID=2744261 RepID=UPI001602C0CE|nr:ImmA/IrrE family metallo-endopeptidase [Bacillus sp. ME78]